MFSNVVQTKVIPASPGVNFTRNRHVEIPVECNMEQNVTSFFTSFHPESSQIIYREDGFGKFSFQLQLYTNNSYVSLYPSDAYPLEVNLKDQLYFQAKVSSQDWLELFIDTCVATQSRNPHSIPQFKLIHEGYDIFIMFEGSRLGGFFFSFFFFFIVMVYCMNTNCAVWKNLNHFQLALKNNWAYSFAFSWDIYLWVTLGNFTVTKLIIWKGNLYLTETRFE